MPLRLTATCRLPRALALAGTACGSMSVSAQALQGACQLSVGYGPIAAPAAASPIPSLTLFSVGVLAATLGVLAWYKLPRGNGKMWAIALCASAAALATQGGEGLIQAVRAAGPYEFNNAAGGTVADASIPYASPAPLITITNSSGVRVKILSNANANETGSCKVGTEVAPGGSCTTETVCQAPAPLVLATVSDPVVSCDFAVTPLYTVSGGPASNAIYSIYPPSLTSAPVFSPGNVSTTTAFSFVPGPSLMVDPVTGNLQNQAAASSGVATVTTQVPAGYVFDNSTQTKTWTINYSGCFSAAATLV